MLSLAAAAALAVSAAAAAGVDCLDDAIAVKSFLCSFRLFVTTQTETSAASRMEDERPKRQQAVFSHSLSLPLFLFAFVSSLSPSVSPFASSA